MSGREMFVFNPDVFVDDDEAADTDTYQADESEEVYIIQYFISAL